MQFNLGVDVAEAQQDVQAKVARIRRALPPDIDEPVIQHFDPNDRPIMSVAVQSAERHVRELTDLADEMISTRFEAVGGVGGVNVVGGDGAADPRAARSRGHARLRPVARADAPALQRENQEVPAGRVSRGATRAARPRHRAHQRPAAFGDDRRHRAQRRPRAPGDVATVVDGAADRRTRRADERHRALSRSRSSRSGTNTVRGGRRRARGRWSSRSAPAAARHQDRDHPRRLARIRESLADVELTIVLGAILTILIIYLFLNSWRSTVITGLTLPVSIISAFFVMWMFGFTMNTMTLLALSLAIGLLIDDAIVVRENIVRHIEMGKDHHQAAREGTNEIGLAVFATTFGVIAVFVPVAFMGGMIGQIFFQFGVTVAFAVLVSLFVSFTLDPMLSSVWDDPEAHGTGRFARIVNGAQGHRQSRLPLDPRLVDCAGPRSPLLIALGTFVGSFALPECIGFEFVPQADLGEQVVSIETPVGSSLEYTHGQAQSGRRRGDGNSPRSTTPTARSIPAMPTARTRRASISA